MNTNEHPVVVDKELENLPQSSVAEQAVAAYKALALKGLKPYKVVGETVIIDDSNDPDHKIRDMYLASEGLSMQGLIQSRQIQLQEANLGAEKAALAREEALLNVVKAQNKELLAQADQFRSMLWIRIAKIADVDDRLRWKFDRKKMQDINDAYETLVIVRTMDDDDEQELVRRRFSQMLAESMGIEDKVAAGLTRGIKSITKESGHYL